MSERTWDQQITDVIGHGFDWLFDHPLFEFLAFMAAILAVVFFLVWLTSEEGPPLSKRTVRLREHYTTMRLVPVGKVHVPQTRHHYRLTADDGATVHVSEEVFNLCEAGEPYIGQWSR